MHTSSGLNRENHPTWKHGESILCPLACVETNSVDAYFHSCPTTIPVTGLESRPDEIDQSTYPTDRRRTDGHTTGHRLTRTWRDEQSVCREHSRTAPRQSLRYLLHHDPHNTLGSLARRQTSSAR